MAKFNRDWQVPVHGPLVELEPGLLTVAAEIRMPLGKFPRRMTIVRLGGGGTLIWSAVPLREPEMAQIEVLGLPSFLVVPGIAHRLDLLPWKKRYPDAKVIAPPGARAAVEQVCPVASTHDVFEDPDVKLSVPEGVGGREAVLQVSRPSGVTLVINDLLANVRNPHGIGAQIMARLFGFGVKTPQMPWVGKRAFVDDAQALAAEFHGWSKLPDLRRIVVSHGEPIEHNPAATLARIAAELG